MRGVGRIGLQERGASQLRSSLKFNGWTSLRSCCPQPDARV